MRLIGNRPHALRRDDGGLNHRAKDIAWGLFLIVLGSMLLARPLFEARRAG